MLVIDQFALPAAVRAAVGTDIVEEGIAAADAAVMQHHDSAVAGVDAVEHADVERIESVADAVYAVHAGRRRRRLADGGHDSVEGDSASPRSIAFQHEVFALLSSLQRNRQFISAEQP